MIEKGSVRAHTPYYHLFLLSTVHRGVQHQSSPTAVVPSFVLLLNPLRTRIPRILQNTALLTQTIPPGRTGGTAGPRVGIAVHGFVINIKVGLTGVFVQAIAKGSSVVTNEFLVLVTDGELGVIAHADRTAVGFVETQIGFGKETIENAGLIIRM